MSGIWDHTEENDPRGEYLTLSQISICSGGTFNYFTFDEVRVGTAFSDVMKTSEASGMYIVISTLGFLLLLNRKRRA